MKITKKCLSLLLAIVMLFSITASIDVSAFAATVTSNQVVSYARKYIGCAYVFGSTGPKTFDCSGLVHHVYKHFGISLPASSLSLWNSPTSYGKVVGKGSIAKAIPGDVIIWKEHVAIYAGNDMLIEALNENEGVAEIRNINSYYIDRSQENV